MRDFILQISDDQGMADRFGMKKAMAALLGDRHDGGQSRYLFSPEPRHELGCWVRLRCLEDVPEAVTKVGWPLELDRLALGDHVHVSAWVALKGRVFQRKGDLSQRVLKGVERYQERFSDALDVRSVSVNDRFWIMEVERGKDRIGRAFSKIELAGEITNMNAVEHLMRSGIGAAKAYGSGLVDIQKVEKEN